MTLRELQLFALDILKDVSDFCIKNHIKYSLACGTLIGAIRSQGFIPWDDDIDLYMPRKDYEKFCNIYYSEKYCIINRENDASFQLAYSRVCDMTKTVFKTSKPCSSKPTGVWIDVFPVDGCPEDESAIPAFFKTNQRLFQKTDYVRSSMPSLYSEWWRLYKTRGAYPATKDFILRIYRRFYLWITGEKKNRILRLIEFNKTYDFDESPFWTSLTCPSQHVVYHPKRDFEYCTLKKFEDSEYYVMNGYDNVLRRAYGDYMELPPEDQQTPSLMRTYTFYWK